MQTPLVVGNRCFLHLKGDRYPSKLLGVSEDTLWVTFPRLDINAHDLGIDIEFEIDGTRIIYHTRVVITPSSPGEGAVLYRTPSTVRKQRRGAWRIPINMEARVWKPGIEEEYTGHIVNLSLGGALLHVEVPFAIDERMKLQLALSRRHIHTLHAQVIHFRAPASADVEPNLYMGIRFCDIDSDAEADLTWFLWKRIRKLYPEEVSALYPRPERRKKGRPKP